MVSRSKLNQNLSQKTSVLGLKLWVLIGIGVGALIVVMLFILTIYLAFRRRAKRTHEKLPSVMIPNDSKEIKEVKVDRIGNTYLPPPDGNLLPITETSGEKESTEKMVVHIGGGDTIYPALRSTSDVGKGTGKAKVPDVTVEKILLLQNDTDGISESESGIRDVDTEGRSTAESSRVPSGANDGDRRALVPADADKLSSRSTELRSTGSPSSEVAQLSWGNWYSYIDLDAATEGFSQINVLGEGGYGIVFRGQLVDGTLVAVKSLLNNRGQAEKEFRVEVEAIGRVRHKNLVRLLGYCIEGEQRMLVYEYVDNGNLEQWLHGPISLSKPLTWEARMKIILGTAKGLTYLHEALEPKVVHRDIKSSNILVDSDWNAKVSDFGLAKLLGSGKSHVTTRVMGTFGYVAPEYANTGLLNERSDVYSFGVLLMEVITGRDPVDYGRASGEVNLVDWLKLMVGTRRSEDVADPKMEVKPTSRALKRALLVALRCVDPDATKRPKMGHVVHMLEAEEFPFRDDRRVRDANRTKRADSQNQDKMIQRLSKEASKVGEQDDSDTSMDSPMGIGFIKKWRRQDG
eukprot:TRINITY_DN24267_c0_g1_i1.p1 TRINITY_DN24267_c0_g1~~TRINITY_DN24267_c0_g1_i1.p1  ORF type:complete len:574 (-),score=82.77 TRINITY_DN24267_c0_g1_i1:292-2013(-)